MPRKTNNLQLRHRAPRPPGSPRPLLTLLLRPRARHSKAIPAAASSAGPSFSYEEVATLAYSYWEARGYQPGNPEADWLKAESELRSRTAAA